MAEDVEEVAEDLGIEKLVAQSRSLQWLMEQSEEVISTLQSLREELIDPEDQERVVEIVDSELERLLAASGVCLRTFSEALSTLKSELAHRLEAVPNSHGRN